MEQFFSRTATFRNFKVEKAHISPSFNRSSSLPVSSFFNFTSPRSLLSSLSSSWRLACHCPARWSWWGRSWWRTRRNTTRRTAAPRRSCRSRFPTPTAILPVCVSRPPQVQVHSTHTPTHTFHPTDWTIESHWSRWVMMFQMLNVAKPSGSICNKEPRLCAVQETEPLEQNSAIVYRPSFSWPSPSAGGIIGCCILSLSDAHTARHWGVLNTSQ